jgi:hypothetical protein
MRAIDLSVERHVNHSMWTVHEPPISGGLSGHSLTDRIASLVQVDLDMETARLLDQ